MRELGFLGELGRNLKFPYPLREIGRGPFGLPFGTGVCPEFRVITTTLPVMELRCNNTFNGLGL